MGTLNLRTSTSLSRCASTHVETCATSSSESPAVLRTPASRPSNRSRKTCWASRRAAVKSDEGAAPSAWLATVSAMSTKPMTSLAASNRVSCPMPKKTTTTESGAANRRAGPSQRNANAHSQPSPCGQFLPARRQKALSPARASIALCSSQSATGSPKPAITGLIG